MPYITIKQTPALQQITFEEIITGNVKLPMNDTIACESGTRTYFVRTLNPTFIRKFNIEAMIESLVSFCQKHSDLYEKPRRELYEKFYIPKKSGGLREINAPVPELMDALRNLKTILETKMYAMHHTSAFAYVTKRSTIDAIKKHQANKSHWFLKTDFSNFFGNTTPKFLLRMLSMIFPFSEIMKSERGEQALARALDLCFLNGGLPQGTPISPMLTNLMMIPIDHRLSNCLRKYKDNTYVYTRYADDIIISSRHDFKYNEIIEFINDTLKDFYAPFTIKEEKTRYGSRAGSNWNLGVMLNKDNQITVGSKNKQRFRAMINNYILDRLNGKDWDLHDVQVLRGLTNYYRMVEKEYIDAVIEANNKKHNVDVIAMMSKDMAV